MAAIDLSKIVVGTRGKVATEAFIAIRNNGQIQFNSLAEKEIEGATRVSFDWDPGKGVFAMIFGGDDLKNSLSISRGKDGQGTPTISGAGVLRAVGFQFQEGNCKLISGSDYKLGKNKTGLSTLVVSGFLTKPRVPATQRAPKSAVVATAVTAADGNENDEVDTDGIL